MFETETPQEILNRMLLTVSDDMDKRQGSIIYDTLMPLAFELHYLYTACDYIKTQSMPTTMDRDNLVEWAKTFNIEPLPATKAIVEAKLVTEPSTHIVENGTRFSGGMYNYVVIEHNEGTTYTLQCETEGMVGNEYTGNIQPIYNVSQLKEASITRVTIPGEEEEDTESFRDRVEDLFLAKPFGGNYTQYREQVLSLQGVGGCKIIGTPTRQATYVDIYIVDGEYKKPTEELISSVQEAIHPILEREDKETLETSGLGLSPIGHDVTVRGVSEKGISIKTNIQFKSGYNWGRVQEEAEEALEKYFLSRAKEWDDLDSILLRVTAIEGALLDVDGIVDIWDTTVNDDPHTCTLLFNEIPVLESIEVTELTTVRN